MTSGFTETFGDSTIYPSQTSYLAIALSADIELAWPIEQQIGGLVVADIMDVTPSIAGKSITLGDATVVTTGYTALFNNLGAYDFTVKDNSGNTILTVAPGTVWELYLNDNSTPAGSWRSFQYGAGVSYAIAASLVGYGIKAINNTLNQKMDVRTINTTPYEVTDADRASLLNWTGGIGDFSFPDPSTLGSDWFVMVRNSGSGALTLTPSTGTINAASNLLVAAGNSAIVVTDGSNYFTVGFGQSALAPFDYTSLDIGGTGNYVLGGSQLNRISYNLFGTLTGNRNFVVPATVQQYWIQNNTTGAFTVTVKTPSGTGVVVPQSSSAIVFSNGTNVVNASNSAGVTLPIAIAQGGTGAVTASAARTALGLGGLATLNSPLPVANGGTEATDAATARANLAVPAAADFSAGVNTAFTPTSGYSSLGSKVLAFSKASGMASISLNLGVVSNGSASIPWPAGAVDASVRPAANPRYLPIYMLRISGAPGEFVLMLISPDGSAQLARADGSVFPVGESLIFEGAGSYPLAG